MALILARSSLCSGRQLQNPPTLIEGGTNKVSTDTLADSHLDKAFAFNALDRIGPSWTLVKRTATNNPKPT